MLSIALVSVSILNFSKTTDDKIWPCNIYEVVSVFFNESVHNTCLIKTSSA